MISIPILFNPVFVLPIFAIVIIFILLALILRKRLAKKNVYEKLCQYYKRTNVIKSKNKAYDFLIELENKKILFKIIYNFDCAEINVNSKDFWQINRGAVSSRKKGEKMKNVYDLIEFDLKKNGFSKETLKIHVIYPNTKHLLKVLNECEMLVGDENTDFYGSRIINYNTIHKQLNNIK